MDFASTGTNQTPILSSIVLTQWRGFTVNTVASAFGSSGFPSTPTFDVTPTGFTNNATGGITFNAVDPGFGSVNPEVDFLAFLGSDALTDGTLIYNGQNGQFDNYSTAPVAGVPFEFTPTLGLILSVGVLGGGELLKNKLRKKQQK